MTPTRSVLLDLDGTLIDSQPGILASCLAALRALGHEPDETLDIKRTIGPPLEDMMQVLLQPYGDDRIGEAVAAYRQHYGESGLLGSEPYPGIGSSLKEMQQAGLRIYLATSKRETFASRILHHLGFATYFDGIHGSVPGGGLDHKPELLAHILSQHNLLPSHSLMVGDRRYDISGAHAVGMRGLGVLWGYGTRDELETAGADQLVESTADLARTVLSWSVGSNLRARPPGGLFKSEALRWWRCRQREFPPQVSATVKQIDSPGSRPLVLPEQVPRSLLALLRSAEQCGSGRSLPKASLHPQRRPRAGADP